MKSPTKSCLLDPCPTFLVKECIDILLPSITRLVNCSLSEGVVPDEFNLFIYLGFYVAFNTVQVISRQVVGRAEETSTYSLLGFCTVNCRPTESSYQLSHLRPCGDRTPASEVGGERVTTMPPWPPDEFKKAIDPFSVKWDNYENKVSQTHIWLSVKLF